MDIKEKIIKEYDGTNLRKILGSEFESPDRSKMSAGDISTRKFEFKSFDIIASNGKGSYVLEGESLIFHVYQGREKTIDVSRCIITFMDIKNRVIQEVYTHSASIGKSFEKISDDAIGDSSTILQEILDPYNEYMYALDIDSGEEFSRNDIEELLRNKK